MDEETEQNQEAENNELDEVVSSTNLFSLNQKDILILI